MKTPNTQDTAWLQELIEDFDPDKIHVSTTVDTFNGFVELIDEQSDYQYDRIEPAHLLKWAQARLGTNAVFCRSFERVIRQLGYQV